jgi:hypothetical protein
MDIGSGIEKDVRLTKKIGVVIKIYVDAALLFPVMVCPMINWRLIVKNAKSKGRVTSSIKMSA